MPRDPVAVAQRDQLDKAYTASKENALGALLIKHRVMKNITRNALADKVGINYGTLWRFETVGGPISDDIADRIALELDIDVFEIHAAQRTIPPALRERIRNLSASDMRTLFEFMDKGV